MTDSTRDTIRRFIGDNLIVDGRVLADDESLIGGNLIDSMGVVDIVTFLEEQFGITVEDDEVDPDNFDSIDRIVAFLESKQAAAHG
jgi:acyl carrier protein